jgi:hypothetical protein
MESQKARQELSKAEVIELLSDATDRVLKANPTHALQHSHFYYHHISRTLLCVPFQAATMPLLPASCLPVQKSVTFPSKPIILPPVSLYVSIPLHDPKPAPYGPPAWAFGQSCLLHQLPARHTASTMPKGLFLATRRRDWRRNAGVCPLMRWCWFQSRRRSGAC